jgi:hypothetical protein
MEHEDIRSYMRETGDSRSIIGILYTNIITYILVFKDSVLYRILNCIYVI